jgi:hypothetical protein
MNVSFIILIITGVLLYNTYHDNFLFKSFQVYQKYYKMGLILVLGLGFYIMTIKDPSKSVDTISALNRYVNVMPIDKNTKDMISPFMKSDTPSLARLYQPSRTTKRSVSETKKKLIASNQSWKCGECREMLKAWFEVDHIKRLDQGGSNDIENLVALCRNCHGKKTSMENI